MHYHNHHIVPKHMNGTDDPSNIERITIEEHAQRHKDLYDKHGYEQDRIAWLMLSGQIDRAGAIKLSQQAPKSESWKKTMSERNTGEGNPNYGNTFDHTDETKEKIREKVKAYVDSGRTPEHNAKIDFTGKIHTEETKQMISQSRKGKGFWAEGRESGMKGKKQSDLQKKTAAATFSKTWKITTPSGESFLITNLREWSRDNNLDSSNLSRGGNGTHKGYRATRQD